VRSLPADVAGSLAICACAAGWGSIVLIVRDVDLPAMTIVFFRVALTATVVAAGLGLVRGVAALRPVKPVVPAIGVLLAALFLDERLTPAILIGGAAILAASAIVILRGAREPASAGQPAPQAVC
jgi:drug/metabolite transporter (DMT)-like permease